MRFDPEHRATTGDVDALLDAARHAPSAGNSQPWAFIVGVRGDVIHERLVRHLAASTARWVPDASVLVANLAHRWVEDSDMEYSEFAHYDLGQAVAHMTFQAHAMGLAVHQFRAFDRDRLAAEFQVAAQWEVSTMAAIGRSLDGDGDVYGSTSVRARRSRDEITWARAHGRALVDATTP